MRSTRVLPGRRRSGSVKRWCSVRAAPTRRAGSVGRGDPIAVDVFLNDDDEANSAGVKVVDDVVMNDRSGIHHKSYGYLRTPKFTGLVRAFI